MKPLYGLLLALLKLIFPDRANRMTLVEIAVYESMQHLETLQPLWEREPPPEQCPNHQGQEISDRYPCPLCRAQATLQSDRLQGAEQELLWRAIGAALRSAPVQQPITISDSEDVQLWEEPDVDTDATTHNMPAVRATQILRGMARGDREAS